MRNPQREAELQAQRDAQQSEKTKAHVAKISMALRRTATLAGFAPRVLELGDESLALDDLDRKLTTIEDEIYAALFDQVPLEHRAVLRKEVLAALDKTSPRSARQMNGLRREPIMQVIDEAARFIPQTIRAGQPELAMCESTWATIVEEGRNIGLGVGLLTQRNARLNKDVRASAVKVPSPTYSATPS